jgi:hypothetical protein
MNSSKVNIKPFDELINQSFEFELPADELRIERESIESWLGEKITASPEIKLQVDEILKDLSKYTKIRCGFKVLDPSQFRVIKGFMFYSDLTFNLEKIISTRLLKSETIAIFTATAGNGLESEARKLMSKGDLLEGYIFDSIGSETAEGAAAWIEKMIDKTAEEHGLKTTSRYSPGYCGWSVKEQHMLFSLLPESFCGILLTESALMYPIKSVSGIIGLGKEVTKEDYQCSVCDYTDCFRHHKLR